LWGTMVFVRETRYFDKMTLVERCSGRVTRSIWDVKYALFEQQNKSRGRREEEAKKVAETQGTKQPVRKPKSHEARMDPWQFVVGV